MCHVDRSRLRRRGRSWLRRFAPAALVALAGCGIHECMMVTDLIDAPGPGKALLRIHRPSAFVGGGGSLDVWDKDEFLGLLASGTLLQTERPPGRTVLMTTAALPSSRPKAIVANLEPGLVYDIVKLNRPLVYTMLFLPATRGSELWDRIPKYLEEEVPLVLRPELPDRRRRWVEKHRPAIARKAREILEQKAQEGDTMHWVRRLRAEDGRIPERAAPPTRPAGPGPQAPGRAVAPEPGGPTGGAVQADILPDRRTEVRVSDLFERGTTGPLVLSAVVASGSSDAGTTGALGPGIMLDQVFRKGRRRHGGRATHTLTSLGLSMLGTPVGPADGGAGQVDIYGEYLWFFERSSVGVGPIYGWSGHGVRVREQGQSDHGPLLGVVCEFGGRAWRDLGGSVYTLRVRSTVRWTFGVGGRSSVVSASIGLALEQSAH